MATTPRARSGIRDARGDIRPDTEVRLAHEMLVGPVFYRLLFSGQPLDDGLAARVADAVLRAFAAE
jgi:hypothetical protein